jgi:O-antigen/teichoic acid export membrane protein
VAILGTVANLRLDAAIPLPETDPAAAAVAWAGGTAAVLCAVATAVVGLLFGETLSVALGVPLLSAYWWLLSGTVLIVAANQMFSAWIVREQRYAALGVRNAAQGTATVATQLGFGLVGTRPLGLLLGMTLGQLAGVGGLTSRRGLLRQPRPALRDMRTAVSRYRRFPLVASWSALLNTVGQQGPVLVISALYGSGAVGLLALTMRVLAAPVALLGRAVGQVFRGESSSQVRSGELALRRTIQRTSRGLLVVGLGPTAVLLAFGPELFSTAFGEEWTTAGEYGQILAIGFLTQLVVSPISQTLLVLERQGTQLAWDAFRLCATVGGPALVFVLGGSATVAISVLSAAYVLCYGVLYALCVRAARRADPGSTVEALP